MAKFKGYLIKLGDTVFPNEYIAFDSYKSTDNQRTELKAYRNSSNNLIRQTSPNFKTKVEFNTISGLKLADMEKIKSIVDKATINNTERKVKVTYWNNEDLMYEQMRAYMPDIEHQIKKITKDDVIYNSKRLAFIQY
ncbi:MAG: DUF6711 family protein [Eubacterium sp.]